MNILYLISCFGHGRGGHLYSLKTIAGEISKTNKVIIVSIGPVVSPVFNDLDKYFPVIIKLPGALGIDKILKLVKEHDIRVVHSFDSIAYFFARIISIVKGLPVMHTKCGGPPPIGYFPTVRELILFSAEDMDFFRNSSKHKNIRLYHIPNRIIANNQDQKAIRELKKKLAPNLKTMMRISRFSHQHRKSLLDSIELFKRLKQDGIKIQLLLIGAIQDNDVYHEIKTQATDGVFLVSENKFTINASRLIQVADLVVGTGRGAMEAAIQGRILLAPVKGMKIPVMVDQDNIKKFFDYNFSARTEIENISSDEAYCKIKDLLNKSSAMEDVKKFNKRFAEENFEIRMVMGKYLEIYTNCNKSNFKLFDMMFHFYITSKAFYKKNIQYSKMGKQL